MNESCTDLCRLSEVINFERCIVLLRQPAKNVVEGLRKPLSRHIENINGDVQQTRRLVVCVVTFNIRHCNCLFKCGAPMDTNASRALRQYVFQAG